MRNRIPKTVIWRAPGLLDMLYTPSEMSAELDVPARSIREWVKFGMPHQRDDRGHLWIHGTAFAKWVDETRRGRPRQKLESDEAYCLRCRRRVKLLNPEVCTDVKPPVLSGKCPNCGGTVNRGLWNDLSR